MTEAEILDFRVRLGQDWGITFSALTFHQQHPSIFFQGAFIFRDGSIWVAR